MATTTITRRIAARADRVFEVATNFQNLPAIISGVKGIDMLTDGPARVGTRFGETRLMRGKPARVEWEVTTWMPAKAWTIASKIPGATVTCEHTLEAAGDATNLKLTMHAQPRGVLGLLIRPMLGKMLSMCEAETHGDLEQLAKACER